MTSAWMRHFMAWTGAVLLFQISVKSAEFAHSGVAYGKDSIAFVRGRLAAKEQPGTKAWGILAESSAAHTPPNHLRPDRPVHDRTAELLTVPGN